MGGNKKYTLRKILVIAAWILLGSGTIVLLVAAITKKNNEQITSIEIDITGVQNKHFIDRKEVYKILEKANGKALNKAIASSLDLTQLEGALQKNDWIKRAEIFFDNNNVLQIKIKEREPVARIFTTSGASFYIDSSLTRLPLSNNFSARLPIFTDFPTDGVVLSKEDSILLSAIKSMGEYIGKNDFWMAQIDQIDITPERTFDLIPKLGNQLIRFGSGDAYEEKFNKLFAFYKQVQTRVGWNRYSIIDLQYKNQVIGVNRNAHEIKMDSLRSIQIMNRIISDAQKNTNDTTNIQLTQPEDDNNNINISRASDNLPEKNAAKNKINDEKNKVSGSVTPIHVPEKPFFKNPEVLKTKPIIHSSSSEKSGAKKEELKMKEEKIKKVPKAVMPPKSDY